MSKLKTAQSIALSGNISEGFRAVGPYQDHDDAAGDHDGMDSWIMTLEEPDGRDEREFVIVNWGQESALIFMKEGFDPYIVVMTMNNDRLKNLGNYDEITISTDKLSKHADPSLPEGEIADDLQWDHVFMYLNQSSWK